MAAQKKNETVADETVTIKAELSETESKQLEEKKIVYPYCVSKGKSITVCHKVLDSGDEVTVDMLAGGKDQLTELVKRKLVDKN